MPHVKCCSDPDLTASYAASSQILARTDNLYKAPEPKGLKAKSLVRIAFDDNALEGTMRWEYGRVVKVHSGRELLDIDLDNGQQLRRTPLYDVVAVSVQ